MNTFRLLLCLLSCCLIGASYPALVSAKDNKPVMKLSSPSFRDSGSIPKIHSCSGGDIAPALQWSNLPPNTQSLALIVDDPDVPNRHRPAMTWTHWVLYNIPSTVSGLPENTNAHNLPAGTLEGQNSWKSTGYRGPCPPVGIHRYFFKLYALDSQLPDLHKPKKEALERAMGGHIIGRAVLVGKY